MLHFGAAGACLYEVLGCLYSPVDVYPALLCLVLTVLMMVQWDRKMLE